MTASAEPTASELNVRNGPPASNVVRSVGRSASIVGAAFIVSRILGLVREVILAHQFGTSGEYDAYVSAFRIPDLLFLVIMSGAFGSAFIPVFAGMLGRGRRDEAWRLASGVISFAAISAVAIGLVMFALAGPVMRFLVAPGLEPEFQQLAANTMRILLLSPILLGAGIAAKGILEAQDQFTLPAIAPVLYNVAIIVSALALAPRLGVYGLAVGVVVGAALHVAVQVPGLVRSGIQFSPSLSRHIEGLGEVGRLLGPRVIGQAAFQVNFIVVNYLASHDGPGKVSALNYSWQLMMLPHGVLALSISTVVFPAMARAFDIGDLAAVRRTFVDSLLPLIFLILPAALGLFVFRTAIVQSIFQSGQFSGESTRLVADPLAFLAAGLAWYAIVEVLTRVFYAMHDTRTPVISGVVIIVINIVLGTILSNSMGYVGLAISLTVSTAIEAFILLVVLRSRLGGLDPRFAGWFARTAAAAAVMVLVMGVIVGPLNDVTLPENAILPVRLAFLGVAVGIAAAAYFLAALYLKVPQAAATIRALSHRVPPFGRLVGWIGLG